MTESRGATKPPVTYRPPCEDLYIYYLEGRVPEPLLADRPGYIGTWEEDAFSFVFFSAAAEATIAALLEYLPHLALIDRYRMPYEEWQGGRVSAFRAGCFHVRPPWEADHRADPRGAKLVDEMAFLLDPGVVFGSGTHPTTRDCMAALEVLYREVDIESVLDLGTGTGILAIAAARLGSRRVIAADFNRLAVRTTRRNIILNEAEDRILAVHGRAEDLVACPAELVIANIHYDVMQRLLNTAGFRGKRYWILSGLLRSEAREVEMLLGASGAYIDRRWTHDHIWHTFLGRHEAS